MNVFVQILPVIVSYLIGSIPFGLLFARLFSGVDVRSVGSGNIGATNVLRASGKKAAILTLLADALKGFLPVLIIRLAINDDVITSFSAAAAVIGHNLPIYLKFKGGKGVATSFGVVLAVAPLIGFVCIVIWLLAAFLWRYPSLAALIAFACYPIMSIWLLPPSQRILSALSLFIFALIYVRHRENIKRLLVGTEPKIGQK